MTNVRIEFEIGSRVYFVLNQSEVGLVTSVIVRPIGIVYEVTWPDRSVSNHYVFELTADQAFRMNSKLWLKLEREFWDAMALNAPNARYEYLYATQSALVGVPVEQRASILGEYIHHGVRGVTMICPLCKKRYDNVHPVAAAYCPCKHPPTRVVRPEINNVVSRIVSSVFQRMNK